MKGTKRSKRKRRNRNNTKNKELDHEFRDDAHSTFSAEFLDETCAAWQPFASRELTRDDAREIVENLTEFFLKLDEWDHKDREKNNS